jgi:carbonic anhydrase
MNISKKFAESTSFIALKIREGFFSFKDDFGSISVDGKSYSLNEIHLKSPSEHAILGNSLPAEMQIRGISGDNKILSMVFLIDKGETNKMLQGMHFGNGKKKYLKIPVEGKEGDGEFMMY